MARTRPSRFALDAGRCLQEAVREELRPKALLGQYVIISRKGRPCRVSAKEAMKMAEGKKQS